MHTIWLTGLPCSGKSTLSKWLGVVLEKLHKPYEILDGNDIREFLVPDLGFSKEDRHQHALRVGWTCRLLNKHGVIAIAAIISPYRESRRAVKLQYPGEPYGPTFHEVFVNCSLDVCESRDTRGLYRKARAGVIENFTGISDPYEEPECGPDVLEVNTDRDSADTCVRAILWDALNIRLPDRKKE